jgi:NAD(P)-dependent dehydrogenase (short-subunit alcohol dehydrogenase family)
MMICLFVYITVQQARERAIQPTLLVDNKYSDNTEKKMGKLDGKIALITGGSDGIGFATAQQFLIEGAAHVFITGRRQDALNEAVKKLGSKKVTAVQGDASNIADLDKLYDVIKKEQGHLDILFANAGIYDVAPLGSITEKHYDNLFNVNVKGVLFTVQKALPIFADGGSIILNASVVSLKGFANNSVYSATKAAVRSFARCWTVDLKERKIRVNALSPGPVDTSVFNNVVKTEEEKKQIHASLAAVTAMGRIGTPDEIAKAAVFLASDDSSYVTGIELFVDGGAGQI